METYHYKAIVLTDDECTLAAIIEQAHWLGWADKTLYDEPWLDDQRDERNAEEILLTQMIKRFAANNVAKPF